MNAKHLAATLVILFYLDTAHAVEFEKMGSAVGAALHAKTGISKTNTKVKGKDVLVYQAKDGSGKVTKYAVVQQGVYPPNCTHTWVVGMAPGAKVEQVRVVEMSWTHAYPTKEASFLSQFQGKSPAQLKTLKSETTTVAKATGSSELTADAVVTSIVAVGNLEKGGRNVAGGK
mgnify:CR=1 FL=1